MRTIRYSFLAVLTAAAFLTGCGSSGVGDIFGDRDPSPSTSDDSYATGDVRGTVERVDTGSRRIIVDLERGSALRNGDDDEIVVYYDDRTTVEHEGQNYRPQDLEPGDRIAADVERSGDRLIAEEIEVLYDVSGGVDDGVLGRDDRDDDVRTADLRGTVRDVDTRDRTLEVEATRYSSSFSTTGRANDVVVVHYDSNTIVEFEGRRYGPENIERGDVVEIEIRDLGSRLLAEEIEVVGEGSSFGR